MVSIPLARHLVSRCIRTKTQMVRKMQVGQIPVYAWIEAAELPPGHPQWDDLATGQTWLGRSCPTWMASLVPRCWLWILDTIQRHDWPARSPDLNPMDFFYWGFLKSKVFFQSHRPWRRSRLGSCMTAWGGWPGQVHDQESLCWFDQHVP